MDPLSPSRFHPRQFPARCPKCLQATGEVRAAGTVVDDPLVIRLTVKCKPCDHAWVIDKLTETQSPLSQLDRLQAQQHN